MMLRYLLVIILIIPAILAMWFIQIPYGIIKLINTGEDLIDNLWPNKLLDWAKK